MDDFFGGFGSSEELYDFLREHFFPKVEWARLGLPFKKLRLFEEAIRVLGVTHSIGGLVRILENARPFRIGPRKTLMLIHAQVQ